MRCVAWRGHVLPLPHDVPAPRFERQGRVLGMAEGYGLAKLQPLGRAILARLAEGAQASS